MGSMSFKKNLSFTKITKELTPKENTFKVSRFITPILEETSLMSVSLRKSIKEIFGFSILKIPIKQTQRTEMIRKESDTLNMCGF